jgi:RimJ/RimL family protein N-acetyltransferase
MGLADLDFVASMLADPAVMRFYPKTLNRGAAEVWVRRQMRRYRDDGHGLWLVLDRESGEPVGQVGLLNQHVDGADEAEIGYLLASSRWGRGYATEAAAAARDHAFRALGKGRVISLIRPENVPSQRVAVRIGMRVEKRAQFAGHEHLVFALARPR